MVYGLADRGLVKPGLRADLVLLAPDNLADNATYREPDRLSDGIQTVFVGGQIVYQDGQLTGAWPGEAVVV
jgi:N-acyl-D-amino-acid deacylase